MLKDVVADLVQRDYDEGEILVNEGGAPCVGKIASACTCTHPCCDVRFPFAVCGLSLVSDDGYEFFAFVSGEVSIRVRFPCNRVCPILVCVCPI